MLDPKQFRAEIVEKPLKAAGLWSPSADLLVFGTGLVESGLRYLRQLNGGPALGFFQMEPATHQDLWDNYLAPRLPLATKITSVAGLYHLHPEPETMIWNLAYAALMCRVHYLRIWERLPEPQDLAGLGQYWKKYYNTPLGKGEPEKFTRILEKHL